MNRSTAQINLLDGHQSATKERSEHEYQDRRSTNVYPETSTDTNSDEVRKKAAAAAQQRHKLASAKEQINQRKQSDESQAEQQAWNDRALATTPRKPTLNPAKKATLPGAAAIYPQPSALAKPRSQTTKQPPSILKQLGADAKRAIERRARAANALNERTRVADEEDITDSQAQQEAEANHALSKPKPYESIRTSTAYNTNTNDDAKPQALPLPNDEELVLEPSTAHSRTFQAQAQEQEHNDERQSVFIERPQGPFSLNSAAGVQAVKKSLPRAMNLPFDDPPAQSAAQRFMGTSNKTPFKKASKGNPDLHPITSNDLQLYKWRAEKISWAEVRQRYGELTGVAAPREDTLRARIRQIEKAIDIDEIPTEMCQQVIDGDKVAEAELNRLVALHGPYHSRATPAPAPFRKVVRQDPVRSAPASVPPAPARPTQGGKSIDYEACMSLLSGAAEAYAASSSDEDADDHLRGSPPAEEDCVRWEYFMQRRDLVSGNLEDDFKDLDEETVWKEYNAAFDQLGHANAEASQFVFTVPAGVAEIFKAEESFNLTYERDSEGMARFDLRTDHGLVQVRVGRRMLTFQDHIMPESKQNWLSKTLYSVAVKTCKKAKDDMFEEGEVESYTLDDAVYGSLEHANSRAMEEWVRLTLKVQSVNYNEVQCKREEAKRELLLRFEDEGEGWAFALAMEDDERSVEVGVKALAMQGPRN